jgi:hypothetical protein
MRDEMRCDKIRLDENKLKKINKKIKQNSVVANNRCFALRNKT